MGTLAPWATFAIFIISAKTTGRTLNTASAYTALSLISLLATPMNTLVRTIPSLNAAWACFDRIEDFLKSDARQDHRLPLFGISEPERRVSPQFIEGIELEPLGPVSNADANSTIIATQNASFAWTANEQPTVSNLNFNIQRHQLLFIIGLVGSGKSTLLKGLLGETPSTQGFVYSTSPETAFVDQSPWVRNGTIRENILGISAFQESWYNKVIHCCGLQSDISSMPKGHGQSGFSISSEKFTGLRASLVVPTPNLYSLLSNQVISFSRIILGDKYRCGISEQLSSV
jgi:ATP-binding cassette subfamily C (CFTR/MRP) protein 1